MIIQLNGLAFRERGEDVQVTSDPKAIEPVRKVD